MSRRPHGFRLLISTGAILVGAAVLCQCSRPSSISSGDRESFVNTYVELRLAKKTFGNDDAAFTRAAHDIFRRNGTDEAFMRDFLSRIASHPTLQQEIFSEIVERLKEYQALPPDSLKHTRRGLTAEP